VRRSPLISRRSSNPSLARELLPYVNAVPSRGPRIRDTGHNVTLAKVKGHSRHRVALSGARDYESPASLHASDTEANVRGIRPWRDEDGGRWGRGRGEGDRWVCCRTGYLTNVRPKPARVGYKRVFCNAPSSEFSPHKASSPLPPLPRSSFLPFLSTRRVDAALARSKVSGFMERLLSARYVWKYVTRIMHTRGVCAEPHGIQISCPDNRAIRRGRREGDRVCRNVQGRRKSLESWKDWEMVPNQSRAGRTIN